MDWLAIIYVLALAAVIAVVPFSMARQWLRRRSRTWTVLQDVGAPASRELQAHVAQATWIGHEVKAAHTVTRLSIRHSARLPYVVQFEGGRVSCYDHKGYQEWTANGGDPRCVPLPVHQLCELDLLKRFLAVPGLAQLDGAIAIEPGHVVAIEDGSNIDSAYAKKLVGVMLQLAVEAEKPAFVLPTGRQAPALS
jgi:hypothetical protein